MLTLAQIAKETGVCKASVSLILNGKAKQNHISDATVEKIQAYCRKVNYMPNIHAVRMNKKTVGNIMVLLNTQDGISRKNSFTDYCPVKFEKMDIGDAILLVHPLLKTAN